MLCGQSYKFGSTNNHLGIFLYFSQPIVIQTRPFVTESITLCFSGHRRYTPSPDDEARLGAALEAAWVDGYRVFISGMASGFDLAAAEAVVRLRSLHAGVRLVAAIPFRGQPVGYTAVDKRRYDDLVGAADEVRVLADRYSHGCYWRRDDWMVERSRRIVCWYDGSSGGTRYTVRRALARGLETVNIWRDPAALF
jgi:uncharacterized phage-like protein YoqJ